MTSQKSDTLSVSLLCDRTIISQGELVTCAVTIFNIGPSRLVLNQRFAVSYRDQPPRDLYFDVETKNGRPYLGTDDFRPSSRALPLTSTDYTMVPPGGGITTCLKLEAYYQFRPGTYRLWAVYDPEPSGVCRNAWAGKLRSKPTTLEVRRGEER